MILIELQYLGPIEYYALLAQEGKVMFEQHENYQKGSYRNRCYLAGPNGRSRLSIPLEKGKHQRKKYKEVTVSSDHDWPHIHWQSLCSCYRSSPYFEYYEDRFEPIYSNPPQNLFELNRKLTELLVELCGIELTWDLTEEYQESPGDLIDMRMRINPRAPGIDIPRYLQVFENKTGFLQPVSVVDLLFSKGPATLEMLMALDLSPLRSG